MLINNIKVCYTETPRGVKQECGLPLGETSQGKLFNCYSLEN
jgi:hypothetical protein